MKPNYKLTIFIIEDDPMYSLMLDVTLEQEFNFQTYHFSSAEESLKNLHLKPDIIILDYYLKGMNGHEGLIKFKKILPDCFVILLSGQEDVETAVNLVKAGAFHYIKKSTKASKELLHYVQKAAGEIRAKHHGFIH
jgi:DNA-binding NtrC family response regulator